MSLFSSKVKTWRPSQTLCVCVRVVWCDTAVSDPEWRWEDAELRPQLSTDGRQSMVRCSVTLGSSVHLLSPDPHFLLLSHPHQPPHPSLIQDWVSVFRDQGAAQRFVLFPLCSSLHSGQPLVPLLPLCGSSEVGAVTEQTTVSYTGRPVVWC